MGLDRSVHSDETADGVTLPVAPGTVVRGDLAQTFTPPPPPRFLLCRAGCGPCSLPSRSHHRIPFDPNRPSSRTACSCLTSPRRVGQMNPSHPAVGTAYYRTPLRDRAIRCQRTVPEANYAQG